MHLMKTTPIYGDEIDIKSTITGWPSGQYRDFCTYDLFSAL